LRRGGLRPRLADPLQGRRPRQGHLRRDGRQAYHQEHREGLGPQRRGRARPLRVPPRRPITRARGGGMRPFLTLSLMVALWLPPAVVGLARAAEERLPTDPALVTGTLPNGLAYIVRPHKNPEGRVSIWLHVGTGSLNETDATRGLAHYLEHLA